MIYRMSFGIHNLHSLKAFCVLGENQLPKYNSVDEEQYAEGYACGHFGDQQGDAVHVTAAEKAAQYTQIYGVKEQQGNAHVIAAGLEDLGRGAADGFGQQHHQICCHLTCERPNKAENTQLCVGQQLPVDVDLDPEAHEVDFFEYTGAYGI